MNIPLLLLLFLSLNVSAGELLMREEAGARAEWGNPPFSDIADTPTTAAGYGITDVISGDAITAMSIISDADTVSPVAGGTTTFYFTHDGWIRGMECDLITAPRDGDLVIDLLIGSPLTSVYSGDKPTIADGETSTLSGMAEALPTPVAIAKRDLIQLKILSTTDIPYDAAVETVGDLPDLPQAGVYLLVLSDEHMWLGRDYGYSYTDLGLAPGLSGAAATTGALPTGQAAGVKYLVDADDHVYTSNGNDTWTDSGTLTTSGIWAGNTIDNVAALNYATPPGSTFLALDTAKLWRNDYAIWTDEGLAPLVGAGLRCNLFILNNVGGG